MTPEEIERNRLEQMRESPRIAAMENQKSPYVKLDVDKMIAQATEYSRTGGPAFPQHGFTNDLEAVERMSLNRGMTLRDYFSAVTLQGLLASIPDDMRRPLYMTLPHRMDFARASYLMADAMLAERAKTK